MPIIKPISSLRNNYPEMSKLARETKQPIFLTKNGSGDMVLLSLEEYNERFGMLELYEKLFEGESDIRVGRIKTLNEVELLIDEKIANHKV